MDFASMSNITLRKILKMKGLPSTGVKSKLITRLKNALEKDKSSEKKKVVKKTVKKIIRKKKNLEAQAMQKGKQGEKEEPETTPIECPDCSSKMEIPDTPGMHEVKCPECGAEGEIEL